MVDYLPADLALTHQLILFFSLFFRLVCIRIGPGVPIF